MSKYGGFSAVEFRKPKRAIFDHSHEKRLTTQIGHLTPIFVKETLPNDTFRVTPEVLVRFAPLLAPLYHRIKVKVYSFFVPTRLLYKDYENFFGNGRLGTETPPVPPRASIQTILGIGENLLDKSSPADYMRFQPIADANAAAWAGINVSLLPWAACYKAWYDWFRDRNFEDDTTILPLASGTLATTTSLSELLRLRFMPWRKDYFTSALTSTQRGTEVLMPMGGTGTVDYLNISQLYELDGTPAAENTLVGTTTGQGNDFRVNKTAAAGSAGDAGRVENIDEITFENSTVSITDFRTALALQSWYERQNVAGSKYNETVYAHFGRRTSDGRLQMADFLGGGQMMVRINEVTTTSYSEDSDTTVIPPGNPTGHSLTLGSLGRFTYNCEEHGFVVMYMAIMPEPGYMEGTDRMFYERSTFLDYPWPTFANLGEQPVYDYEIFDKPGSHITDKPIFGYQSRYADWKYTPSSSHGDFRYSLEYWHMDRKFGDTPVLGQEFVTMTDQESQDLSGRVFAVGAGSFDTLWCYIFIKCFIKRSLPYFGTPHLVG